MLQCMRAIFLSLVFNFAPRSTVVSEFPWHPPVQDLLPLAGHSCSGAYSLPSPLDHTAKCWGSPGLRPGPHSFLHLCVFLRSNYTVPWFTHHPFTDPSFFSPILSTPWAPASLMHLAASPTSPPGYMTGLSDLPQVTELANGQT